LEFPNGIYTSATNSGRPVTIYTITAGGDRPIHGSYYNEECWIPVAWTKEGRLNPNLRSSLDLVIPSDLADDLSAIEE
jgi:hypothetical protein